MDRPAHDEFDETASGGTPEDVAVLYSWANLQGAKYRDFSASRREYRAQMRLRAAEDQRSEEVRLKEEAESAASDAERAAREAEEAARFHESAARRAATSHQMVDLQAEEAARERALRHANEMSRIAAAERIEAARRSEAVAAAEAASRRESREMEDAHASAERQAQRYAESEIRRRELAGPQPSRNNVPGQISDPYQMEHQPTLPGRIFHQPSVPDDDMLPSRHPQREVRLLVPQPDPEHRSDPTMPLEFVGTGTLAQDAAIAAKGSAAMAAAARKQQSPVNYYHEPNSVETAAAVDHFARRGAGLRQSSGAYPIAAAVPVAGPLPTAAAIPVVAAPPAPPPPPKRQEPVMQAIKDPLPGSPRISSLPSSYASSAQYPAAHFAPQPPVAPQPVAPAPPAMAQPPAAAVSPNVEPLPAPTRNLVPVPEISVGQRAYAAAKADAQAKAEAAQAAMRRARGYAPDEASGFFAAYGSARVPSALQASSEVEVESVPAWLSPPTTVDTVKPSSAASVQVARMLQEGGPERRRVSSSPAPVETLQNSRERVASRWYALKGVFDHSAEEQQAKLDPKPEGEPVVPLVAIFSLAGGVGKTSMVATLGRSLSATGEKVLLTDTTSHGLLPFYFGASELRPGVMRTFSPPSGSNDAAIYLLAYDVMQKSGDMASQDWFSTEINKSSVGMARVLLDLSSCTPWVARRLARMDATVLIPVAPDMNSVISLGPVEKFFAEIKDRHGNQVEPFYILNGFDAALPLHLDVREVMRRQLDDRLLPFVIRRAPAVPEALAEGMTVVDYAPDSTVAEDYRNLAAWLKARSAPATAGNKTARWSER